MNLSVYQVVVLVMDGLNMDGWSKMTYFCAQWCLVGWFWVGAPQLGKLSSAPCGLSSIRPVYASQHSEVRILKCNKKGQLYWVKDIQASACGTIANIPLVSHMTEPRFLHFYVLITCHSRVNQHHGKVPDAQKRNCSLADPQNNHQNKIPFQRKHWYFCVWNSTTVVFKRLFMPELLSRYHFIYK